MRTLLTVLLCLWSTAALAQPAPTITTTLQTTDTTTTSVKVGCALGSGSCTGGILSGPISATLISLSSGYVEIQSFVPASQTNRLVNNSGTLQWNGTPLATGSSLSGTTNTIAVFTGPSAVGNSIMTQSGTTVTVANTLSATTLTGTLSTTSQPNVTTMAALASVGTITTGTWNATKIGLLYGGTNADLSGTGGTSQFLRQNTLGAAVTVVRPQVADLSDNSNVALLNASNIFQVTGNSFGTGTGLIAATINGGSAITAGPYLQFQRNSIQKALIGTDSAVLSSNSDDLDIYSATGNVHVFGSGIQPAGLTVTSTGIRYADGVASVANNTATTLYTITTAGKFNLYAYIAGSVGGFSGHIEVVSDGTGANVVANASAGAGLTFSLSGLNIQCTQTSGITNSITWSLVKYSM